MVKRLKNYYVSSGWGDFLGSFLGGLYAGIFLALFVAHAVSAQGAVVSDKPKNSKEVCGYTLDEGEVMYMDDDRVWLNFSVRKNAPKVYYGTLEENEEKFQSGPVCALKHDNPKMKNVRIIVVYAIEAEHYLVPMKEKREINGLLIAFSKD